MGVAAFLGAERAGFSCARPMNSTASSAVKPARGRDHVVFALSLAKSTHGIPLMRANRCTAALNASVTFASGAVEAMQTQLPVHVGHQAGRVLQAGNIDVEIHRVDALDLEHHMLGQDVADDRAMVMMGSDRTAAS